MGRLECGVLQYITAFCPIAILVTPSDIFKKLKKKHNRRRHTMMKVSRAGSGKSDVSSTVRKMEDYEFFCQG